MPDPTACAWRANTDDSCYCANCDLLVGLPGLHVAGVDRDDVGVLRATRS